MGGVDRGCHHPCGSVHQLFVERRFIRLCEEIPCGWLWVETTTIVVMPWDCQSVNLVCGIWNQGIPIAAMFNLIALIVFASAAVSAPTFGQTRPETPDERRARVISAMRRIELDVKWARLSLKLPSDLTIGLDHDVKQFREDFPEYSDDLDRYLALALPWYPIWGGRKPVR